MLLERLKRKIKLDNKGSATLEATLTLPIFIIAVIGLYYMGQCKLAEAVVYEAAVETSEYLAEFAYLSEPNQLLAGYKFSSYIDDKALVEKYVEKGIKGVSFLGSYFDGEYVRLKVDYSVGINLPIVSELRSKKSFVIKQRYYKGNKREGEAEVERRDDDKYVFVTDNRDVYHAARSCTHLFLSISSTSVVGAENAGYLPCERCGRQCGDVVFITDKGGRYHSNVACSGLKRTIYRVKRSEVEGLGGCSRCVK